MSFSIHHGAARGRSRSGFTLVELLVVIAIIGVLVGLLLPAVQSARETARKSTCQNNIKQHSLGLLNYAEIKKGLPPSYHDGNPVTSTPNTAAENITGLSWACLILPFNEGQEIWDQIVTDTNNLTVNWLSTTGGTTRDLGKKAIKYFECPTNEKFGEPSPLTYSGAAFGRMNYAANAGTSHLTHCTVSSGTATAATIASGSTILNKWGGDKGGTFGPYHKTAFMQMSDIRDGLSKTVLLTEYSSTPEIGGLMSCGGGTAACSYNGKLWIGSRLSPSVQAWYTGCETSDVETWGGNDANHMLNRSAQTWGNVIASSPHLGGAFFSLCDGAVVWLNDSIDMFTYQYLRKRNDGKTIPSEAFNQ